ncbi:NUDIX domain-containing protein [Micromonospora sp. C51]|nr:NUDIX domain-containing protein [Micromonospora sp. C51]
MIKCRRGGRWALPGGHISPGETAADAAARDLIDKPGWSSPPTDPRIEIIDRQEFPESRQRLLGSRA